MANNKVQFVIGFHVQLPSESTAKSRRVVRRLRCVGRELMNELRVTSIDVSNLADITRSLEDMASTLRRARASKHQTGDQ